MEVAESTLLFRAFRQQLGRFWLALRESAQPIWFDQGLKRHGREIVLSARMENNRNIYKVKANNTKVCQNRNRLWRLARLIPSTAQSVTDFVLRFVLHTLIGALSQCNDETS
jgi:hypothetical protein